MIRRPWERYPNETDEAFSAFNAFLSMHPPRRSLRLAGPWPLAGLQQWCRDHRWEERAREWDNEIQSQYRGEFCASVRKVGEKAGLIYAEIELEALRLTQIKVSKALRDELATTATTPTKLGEITRSLKDLQHCARLARGESTENVTTTQDLSRLTPEELELFAVLAAKLENPNGAEGGP